MRKGENTFWSDDALGGTAFMTFRHCRQIFPRHAHDTWLVAAFLEGGLKFGTFRGGGIARRGSILLMRPETVHIGLPCDSSGYTYRAIYPKESFLSNALTSMGTQGTMSMFGPFGLFSDPEMFSVLLSLHCAYERHALSLERESLFLKTVRLLARHFSRAGEATLPPPGKESHAVSAAREYLDEKFAGSVSLRELAEQVHLSPYYLLRVFTREVGMPPHAYVLNRRVRYAKELLQQGVSPTEAAQNAGFSDQSHLYRHFKRILGVTPGVCWRQ